MSTAIIEKKLSSFAVLLQDISSIEPGSVIVVKYPTAAGCEKIVGAIRGLELENLAIADSPEYFMPGVSVQQQGLAPKNILATTPDAWEGLLEDFDWENTHAIFLLSNSMQAEYQSDQLVVLDEWGEVFEQRVLEGVF